MLFSYCFSWNCNFLFHLLNFDKCYVGFLFSCFFSLKIEYKLAVTESTVSALCVCFSHITFTILFLLLRQLNSSKKQNG